MAKREEEEGRAFYSGELLLLSVGRREEGKRKKTSITESLGREDKGKEER